MKQPSKTRRRKLKAAARARTREADRVVRAAQRLAYVMFGSGVYRTDEGSGDRIMIEAAIDLALGGKVVTLRVE